jgi:hypothetical protein
LFYVARNPVTNRHASGIDPANGAVKPLCAVGPLGLAKPGRAVVFVRDVSAMARPAAEPSGGRTMQPDIVITLAGLAFVVGYLIINQVILRLVLLLGTALYILYYYIAGDAPLWGAIYASILTFTANLIGLGLLFARRAWWMVPSQFRDLRDRFSSIPPGDLRSVLRHAQRVRLEQDLVMTREGVPVDTLYFVLSGKISAEKLGEQFMIPAGVFVGEVAFLTGRASSATISVGKGAEVIRWSIPELTRQTRRSPRTRLALEALISTDLAAKVALAVAPKNLPPEYA